MNRILIPLALVVLVAGCAMPSLFGQQAGQPVVADSARTVVVREIYHETPVVYVDTVYLEQEPVSEQPVYVDEHNEYNEYNEYNETYVYVHEQVVVPPPPPNHRDHGWSPGEHERPRDGRRDDGSPRDRNRPRDQEKPKTINPRHPVKKTIAPATNDRQKSPVPPLPLTPPYQPVLPKRQAPAQGGSVPAAAVQQESPKQAPILSVDKRVVPAADEAQVQIGLNRARRK
jgi:hypothetical protein